MTQRHEIGDFAGDTDGHIVGKMKRQVSEGIVALQWRSSVRFPPDNASSLKLWHAINIQPIKRVMA
jgi:hypothetical protein